MPKKPALGRGLDSIFTDNSIESTPSIQYIRLSDIEPKKNQPRKLFDAEALSQLADSIALHGVLQPILVRPVEGGFYQIIAGERRWRASRMAGLDDIPCIIMEADSLKTAQLALIENLQRENLNAYEEALAYSVLIREYSLTQEEVASQLGCSRSAVANSLRLLDLPDDIVAALRDSKLSAGHCRALLGLRDRSQMQVLASKIINRNLSVREVEATVKSLNRSQGTPVKPQSRDYSLSVNYYDALSHRATEILGRRCRISGNKNRHVVQLEYTDNEDLEALLLKLCGDKILD